MIQPLDRDSFGSIKGLVLAHRSAMEIIPKPEVSGAELANNKNFHRSRADQIRRGPHRWIVP